MGKRWVQVDLPNFKAPPQLLRFADMPVGTVFGNLWKFVKLNESNGVNSLSLPERGLATFDPASKSEFKVFGDNFNLTTGQYVPAQPKPLTVGDVAKQLKPNEHVFASSSDFRFPLVPQLLLICPFDTAGTFECTPIAMFRLVEE